MLSRVFILTLALAQPLLAAEPAPLFSGTALDSGEHIRLADYRGKVVLVDFWASWCPPCLESLPAYDRLRRELGSSGFEVIAINVDEETDDGVQFLLRNPVSFPVLADPDGAIGIPYGVRSLPRSFLLNRDGEIVTVYKRFRPGDEAGMQHDITRLLTAPD